MSRLSMKWQRGGVEPALLVCPRDAVSLADARGAIELWQHYSRKRLDKEQVLAVELMLATRRNGMWAARSTGRSVSRQNGKGDETEVVEAWDLLHRGAPVVHTAHEYKTAKSAHGRLAGFLHVHSDLRRKVKQVRSSATELSIEMRNGGIVSYQTRTAGGGRGLDDIARLVVDEAQWAQPEQLAASTPILAVNPNPQTNFTGSAGVSGRSAWWWSLRKRALAGNDDGFAWLEHSAERISLVNGEVKSLPPDPYDRKVWVRANFAHPTRISDGFLAEQLGILGPELFAREHLNVWDPDDGDAASAVFPAGKWRACHGLRPRGLKPDALAVAMSFDGTHAAVGASVLHEGIVHVMPLQHGAGTSWVVQRAKAEQDRHGVDVVVDEKGPAARLIKPLEDAAVRLKKADLTDMLDACADVFDMVNEQRLRHESFPELDSAVGAAVKRSVGDRWALGRRVSSADISVLEVCLLAAWWADKSLVPAIF